MKKAEMFLFGFVVGMLVTLISILLSHSTYEYGQIDALTGKIKYQLVTYPDSTRSWEYKSK